MSTLKTNTIQHLTSGFNNIVTHTDGAGTVNAAHCRAWVNFNGVSTVTIRANFNVSSITDNGTGDYTVNFSNALSDADYSVTGTQRGTSILTSNGIMGVEISSSTAPTTSAVRVWSKGPGGTGVHDATAVCVAIFR